MFSTEGFIPLNNLEKDRKRGGKKGSLTMICSAKNGKRLLVSAELVETLKLADTVKIGFIDNTLVLGKHLPGENNTFRLKKLGKKLVVYSSELVRTIAEKQSINFENKVSHTWYKSFVEEYENSPIVLFKPEVKEDE